MNLQRCGTVAILFLALICITQTAEASKKKKRVIVKVPTRVKHIYHHHTKNLHIHKPKPKPDPVKIYEAPRSRPPVPYSGGKKRSQPWRDEKAYDDDYGYDEYDYGYGGYGDDKGRYKDNRGGGGRWKDEKRGGYDYDAPKRGRWTEESKRAKGYSGHSKRSPQWKNSRRTGAKKQPYRDMYEGAGTAPWPEVKEHDSWHQPRPQGFQQSERIIPADQYHDTSIHAIDYTDKQPSNFNPSDVPIDQPFNRVPFERPHQEAQPSEHHPSFDRPLAEPLHHPPPPDYHESQPSNLHPIETPFSRPTGPYPIQTEYDQTQSFHNSQRYQPHHQQ